MWLRDVETKLWKTRRNVTVVPRRTVKTTFVVNQIVNSSQVPIAALGFAVITVTFVLLGICVGRKKMNVTLQNTATGPRVSAQMTRISRMEPRASTKPVVSGRAVDPHSCSAKAFLDRTPGRLLSSATKQLT